MLCGLSQPSTAVSSVICLILSFLFLSYHYFILIVPVSDITERVSDVPSPLILIGLQRGR